MRCRGVSLFVAGLLIACGGSGGSEGGGSSLASLAISDAKALFIAGSSGQPSGSSLVAAAPDVGESATEQVKLYKLTADDTVLEVTRTCVDRDGTTSPCTTSLTAQAVYDAGPDYVMICFGEPGALEPVLARKSDGAAFSMIAVGFPHTYWREHHSTGEGFLGSTPVQTDATQDLYFAKVGGDPGVVRLDVHDPGNITGAIITPETYAVSDFLVNREGDLWFRWPGGERFRFEEGGHTPILRSTRRGWELTARSMR